MPTLQVEAEKLSNNKLLSGVVEEIIDVDDMFRLMDWEQVGNKALLYNRENTLAEAEFISPVIDTVPEEASTFTEVVARLRVLAGDVDVDSFLNTTMSDHNPQKGRQLAAKAKGIGRKFQRTLARGNSALNPKEFDGVKQFVTANQTLQAGPNGAALTYSMLDELVHMVPNGPDVLVMRRPVMRAYMALLRLSGGIEPQMVMIENFGRAILGHNGVPIIPNDWLENDETLGSGTNLSSVYALRLNTVDGFHCLYGGENLGFAVEDIGILETKDSTRTRMKWYCGTALKSTLSIARLAGISNA